MSVGVDFIAGVAYGAGMVSGGIIMLLIVDWIYRRFGRP